MTSHYDTDHLNTVGGTHFRPCDPDPADVALSDIAHGLAHTCRLSGQSRYFYSVAQHSLNVRRALAAVHDATPQQQLYGLFHDASEAYLADVPGMVKDRFAGYRRAEDAIMDAIWEWLDCPPPTEPPVWEGADYGVLQVEGAELLRNFQADRERHDRYADCVTIESGGDFAAVRAAFIQAAEELAVVCDAAIR